MCTVRVCLDIKSLPSVDPGWASVRGFPREHAGESNLQTSVGRNWLIFSPWSLRTTGGYLENYILKECDGNA